MQAGLTFGAALVLLVSAAHADCGGGWAERRPMGVPRQEIGVAAIGGMVYAIGGFDDAEPTTVAEAYDTSTDRWLPIAPLPLAVHHVGAAAAVGKLYAIGGLTGPNFAAVDDVFEYNPATDTWRARARLPAARGAMGLAVIGDLIYAAGGFRGGASIADFAVYDPAADAWTVLPDMPTARDHLAAGAIGGLFYAVGGRAAGRLFAALESFDPGTGAWRTDLAPMPTARGGLMAAALGSRLFTFGGEGNQGDPLGVFPETEVYESAGDRWAGLEPMLTPRHGTAAVTVGDGIYVPGGASRQGFGISGVNQVFVPPTTAPLTIRRARLRGVRLRLRGRFAAEGALAGLPTVLRVVGQDGAEIASLTVPADGFTIRGRRLVYQGPRGSRGIIRLVLVREPNGAIAVRALAVITRDTPRPTATTVTLSVGDTPYCGTAPLRAR